MRENLRLSQQSAIRFLDAIPRARDLILLFFDRDIQISRYNSENQQDIYGLILETKGEGYTALYDAVAVYVSRVMGTSGRKVLVLFTDGDDTTSSTPASRRVCSLRLRSARGIKSAEPQSLLKCRGVGINLTASPARFNTRSA